MSNILVLGTADWSQPIATNQHYMVRELAQEYDLIYTESMALRSPELRMRDIRRAARRLGLIPGGGEAPHRAVPPSVHVRSPKVIPRHTGMAAKLNRPRVHALVRDWISQSAPRLLWTYSPVTYGLEKYATSVVYHCVDLLGQVEGIPQKLIDDSERLLSANTTAALGTSPVVVDHLRTRGFPHVLYWPNVADTAPITAARLSSEMRSSGRLVFAGNLSVGKVDFELLAQLARMGMDLHLAGPIAEGGGSARKEVEALVAAGAHYHGMLQPNELADLYWSAEIGLIPYALNHYTRGVNPLKTYEYLAAGLAVVSTKIPAVEPMDGHVLVASSRSEFVRAVTSLLPSRTMTETRQRLAETHSWNRRGLVARELVRELLS